VRSRFPHLAAIKLATLGQAGRRWWEYWRLASQPEIATKLAVKKRKPLVSRITITSTLDEFTFEDMKAMIEHRLKVAGWTGAKFTEDAAVKLYEESRGVPRNIVKVCNLAFEMATINETDVTPELIIEAASSTLYKPIEEHEEDEENEL
jgi:MSHA biogenesis protein MshM